MHLHTLSTYYNCYVFEQEPVPCTFSSILQPRESIRFVSRNPCRVPSLQYTNHVNRFVLFPETRGVYLRFNTTTTWIDSVCFQKPVPCTFASILQPRESIRFVSRNPCRVPSLQYYNHVNRCVFVSMHSLLLMHVHIISLSFSKTLFSNSTIFGIFVLPPQFILVLKKTNEKAHGMCNRGIVIANII